MKITDLPYDILVEIVFDSVINSLSIDNFKNEPSILSSHPLFLSLLKYFNDEKWQIICNMIIETPEGFRGDNWKETFLKLVKIKDMKLFRLTLEGNFGKIRMINVKDKYKNKVLPNNYVSALFKFSYDLKHLEIEKEKSNLLQILREFSEVKLDIKMLSYISILVNDLRDNNEKYGNYLVHMLRELKSMTDNLTSYIYYDRTMIDNY
tara:strand:+ start:27 stop:647 length:621 start_codon:yes stop_codon:yes gene_type:complete